MARFGGEAMKPYLLFAGWDYYPDGGMKDYRGDFETIEKCVEEADLNFNWWQIVTRDDMTVIWTNYDRNVGKLPNLKG